MGVPTSERQQRSRHGADRANDSGAQQLRPPSSCAQTRPAHWFDRVSDITLNFLIIQVFN
jgi:hypothetical protein